jgi:hypothetical protein
MFGSATTYNALESFNGNVLERDIAACSRLTTAQLFNQLDSVYRSDSELSIARRTPNSSIDVRPCVQTKPHMKSRVQDLYEKAVELRYRMEESFHALHQSDGSGDFVLVSSNSIGQDLTNETVLARQN